MANLIITVISIALVAVAALMGAWYGGQAFIESQTQAKANTLIAHAEQVASAIRLWSANNGGTKVLTGLSAPYRCYITSSTPLLTQNYLSQLPAQDWQEAVDEPTAKWTYTYPNGGVPASCNGGSVIITQSRVALISTIDKICTAINASVGISSIPAYVNGSWDFATHLANKPYMCMKNNSNPNYYFVYRVF